MNIRALWVDDDPTRDVWTKPITDNVEWDIARNSWDALSMLDTGAYSYVSLDHDLASFVGNKEITGRDILNWLIERKINQGDETIKNVWVHSANCVGVATMEEDIKRYWP